MLLGLSTPANSSGRDRRTYEAEANRCETHNADLTVLSIEYAGVADVVTGVSASPFSHCMLFISHRSKDQSAADQLKSWLVKSGYSEAQSFLDSDAASGIPAGSDWERVLYHRLQDCEALAVITSQNWSESKWCFAELVYAKQAGKQVFPLILDDAVYPAILSHQQAVFPGRDAYAYQRLFAALANSHLGPKDRFEWDPGRCPFPGMPAFDESMAAVYFGREGETQAILDTL
jgi:hypothetical protein